MDIISITRDTKGVDIPATFVVGKSSMTNTQQKEAVAANDGGFEYEAGPAVKTIKFYETGCFQGKAYRGKCYVISFVNSTVKRVVMANTVIDIAVEITKEVEQELPKLPE